MEPLTILLTALSFAGTALKPVGDEAIKDGYAGLKALILRKFASKDPDLTKVLDQNESRPEVYKPAAEAVLKQVGADRDQEIVDRATELLKRVEGVQPGATQGLVGQINAQGGRIVVAQIIHDGVNMGDTDTSAAGKSGRPVTS